MNQLHTGAVLLVLAGTLLGPALGEAADPIQEAGKLLASGQPARAVQVLESALEQPRANRSRVVELLRQAYKAAADDATRKGMPGQAQEFLEYLAILNRKAPPSIARRPGTPQGAAESPSTPSRPAVPFLAEAPAGLKDPQAPTRPADPELTAIAPLPQQPGAESLDAPLTPVPPPSFGPDQVAPAPEPDRTTPGDQPEERPSEPSDSKAFGEPPATTAPPIDSPAQPAPAAATGVEQADAEYLAKRYKEAGLLYARLSEERRLPQNRKEHWAYCRLVGVVDRINAGPANDEEWARIDAELAQIRALSPKNWYGEYLRRRAAERIPGQARARSGSLVIRGSAPEEKVVPEVAGTRSSPGVGRPTAPPARRWEILETSNFKIFHEDPDLARGVAQIAERIREEQSRRWGGAKGPLADWSPRCDIYLYPTARIFREMTGQPEDSPGFSTMGVNGGRVIARRVNLRADHPGMTDAVLPHEVTHVVLADLFTSYQIPRWADEGMAVLSEPSGEQRLRAADLEEPLKLGRLFRIEDLMKMDYPDGQHWSLYYAQSVSLTRFLVERGTPEQFVRFLQRAQQADLETELRRSYQIDGFADLQRQWFAYARLAINEQRPAELTDSAELEARRE